MIHLINKFVSKFDKRNQCCKSLKFQKNHERRVKDVLASGGEINSERKREIETETETENENEDMEFSYLSFNGV